MHDYLVLEWSLLRRATGVNDGFDEGFLDWTGLSCEDLPFLWRSYENHSARGWLANVNYVCACLHAGLA